MKVLAGMRIIWSQVEPRKKPMIESIFLAWANVALINGFATYALIAKTHKADLVSSAVTLGSVLVLSVWCRLRLRPLILAALADAQQERRTAREVQNAAPLIVRGGFGRNGQERLR